MGYSTAFSGAIKVTPMVDAGLAIRLNLFLSLRHSKLLKRPEMRAYMEPLLPSSNTMIPMVDDAVRDLKEASIDANIASHLIEPGGAFETQERAMSFEHSLEANLPEWDGFSLYSHLWIVQDSTLNCSFLCWDGAEKTQAMDKWLSYVVDILAKQGYQQNGTMIAQGESDDDKWTLLVQGNHVSKLPGHLEPTWAPECEEALSKSESAAQIK